MNDKHWETCRVIDGEVLKEKPVGFIIDSRWLPGSYGQRYWNILLTARHGLKPISWRKDLP